MIGVQVWMTSMGIWANGWTTILTPPPKFPVREEAKEKGDSGGE